MCCQAEHRPCACVSVTLLSLCGWCVTASRWVQLRHNRTDHVRGNTHGQPVLRAHSLQILFQCFPLIALHVGATTISISHMRKARGRPGDPYPTPWVNHFPRELQGNKTMAADDKGLDPTSSPPPAQSQRLCRKGEKSQEKEETKGKEGRKGLKISLAHGICQALHRISLDERVL